MYIILTTFVLQTANWFLFVQRWLSSYLHIDLISIFLAENEKLVDQYEKDLEVEQEAQRQEKLVTMKNKSGLLPRDEKVIRGEVRSFIIVHMCKDEEVVIDAISSQSHLGNSQI